MSRKKKQLTFEDTCSVPLWLTTMLMVLSLFCILWNFHSLATGFAETAGWAGIVSLLVTSVSSGCAIVYTWLGYTKNAAPFYRMCLSVFGMALLSGCVFYVLQGAPELVVPYAVCLVCVAVLAIGKDLGEQLSMSIAGVGAVAAGVAICIATGVYLVEKGEWYISSVSMTAFLEFGIVLTMVYAKYRDKNVRGSE